MKRVTLLVGNTREVANGIRITLGDKGPHWVPMDWVESIDDVSDEVTPAKQEWLQRVDDLERELDGICVAFRARLVSHFERIVDLEDHRKDEPIADPELARPVMSIPDEVRKSCGVSDPDIERHVLKLALHNANGKIAAYAQRIADLQKGPDPELARLDAAVIEAAKLAYPENHPTDDNLLWGALWNAVVTRNEYLAKQKA